MHPLDKLRPYAKAVIGFLAGFLTPGLVLALAALTEASPGGTSITAQEWITIAIACLTTGASTGGFVYRVPNRPRRAMPEAPAA